jgi:putative methyltransferase (TIGR04325 family)
MFQNLYVFELARNAGIAQVYETGGAAGNWYHVINSFTGNAFPRWTIREQEPLVKRIAVNKMPLPAGLAFVSEREPVSAAEAAATLYMAQGVLQYLPDPLDELRWAFSQGFRLVYITRTPVLTNQNSAFSAIQRHFLADHAPGFVADSRQKEIVEIPLTLVSEEAVFAACPPAYRVVFSAVESESAFVKTTHPPVSFHETGILFEKRS